MVSYRPFGQELNFLYAGVDSVGARGVLERSVCYQQNELKEDYLELAENIPSLRPIMAYA